MHKIAIILLTCLILSNLSEKTCIAVYEDYTEEEIDVLIDDMIKYSPKIEKNGDILGYSTDRYSFSNGKYYPVYSESDLNWQEYLKHRTNLEVATIGLQDFFDCNSSGRCVGMSLSSALAHNGIIAPSDIQDGKNRLIDITASTDFYGIKTDKVMQKIISYQSRQLSTDFRLLMYYNFSHYDRIKCVDTLIETARKATAEGKWFFMAYDDVNLCHAVVGMGLIEGDFILGDKKYDSCILTYDSNFDVMDKKTGKYKSPDKCAVNGCIFINSLTRDVFVPAYFMDDCGEDFKIFTLYDNDFMNYRGIINPCNSYDTDVSSLNCIEIKSNSDYTIERIENEERYDVISECGKTYERNKKTVYYCDGNIFNVKNIENSTEFVADFMDVRQIYTTTFNGCVNNVFKGEDEFGFDTLGETSYDVTIAFEEGCYDFVPHYRFDFSGITDSDFKAIQTDRGIIVSGSNGVQCSLKTSDVSRDENGLLISAEENIHEENIFASNSVLIAFDDDKPKFYIGENYEKEVQKGDVNCDRYIDAVDASFVLQAYSALSTGGTTYLSKNLADWDDNGMIDAVDASFILQKYAELSTTKS